MRTICTSPLPSLHHVLSEPFIDSHYYNNFHGEQYARLNFNQSVHGWKYHPSKTMMVCAPLLFFSPTTSIRHLHTILVDKVASKEKWNAFVTHLSSQLQDSNLLVSLFSVSFHFISVTSDTLHNRLRFF